MEQVKAIEIYQKAAINGNLNAMFNLGNCFYFGKGIEQDQAKAIEYYEKAALFGNSDSINMLGVIFYRNETRFWKDYSKAIEKFMIAANLENKDALYNMSYCYEKGIGIKRDAKKKNEYRQMAEILGPPTPSAVIFNL